MQEIRKLVLISGCSGSGKTTFAENLIDAIEARESSINCSLFSFDAYYRDQSHMKFEDRIKQNYDHPDAIDFDLLAKHLKLLLNGKTVNIPVYSFKEHTRVGHEEIQPVNLLVAEGIFALYDYRIRKLAIRRIYIDTDIEICFQRRLKRDIEERGRTLDSVKKQWDTTVLPGYENFVKPAKNYADSIINWEGDVEELTKKYIPREVDSIMRHFAQSK